jgi:uncharacterized lipoprotein YddW (UPF0748 family)
MLLTFSGERNMTHCNNLAFYRRIKIALALGLICMLTACASTEKSAPETNREVRGTWITTTANTAIATPANTAKTMKRLREIGLNTVYVEVWKNGYTQFPSEALNKVIGVHQRPNFFPQDPSDSADTLKRAPRDLLQETLIEAHRNGLITMAWFEYGFMAAYKTTNPHLRRMKPEILSRDITGNEVAPNGFVWMNPLHPVARKLLLDIVLEAVDKYDLDGVQLDDRIVWPYITMGYDDYTKKIYAEEHNGAMPPANHKDAAWMRWRADKVNEYARIFVQEVRAKRPNLIISLSPAVYPWSWEYYLLEWPKWGAWTAKDALQNVSPQAKKITPRWDEFIPQVYRFTYPAFEKTWLEQIEHMKVLGGDRQKDMLAGIRVVGEGKDSTWDELRQSIDLTRKTGSGGHVLWFSRGVLDVYPNELTTFYNGHVESPKFEKGWRRPSIGLFRGAIAGSRNEWSHPDIPRGRYRLIGHDGKTWHYVDEQIIERSSGASGKTVFFVDAIYREVELILDRR